MDFVRYAERGASLLNADLSRRRRPGRRTSRAASGSTTRCTERDLPSLRRFQKELRPVFEASDAGDMNVDRRAGSTTCSSGTR